MQHLKAYASTDALKNACIDPRFKYVTRGCAEYVEWLGQKENPHGKGWAAGASYGEKILAILKGILGMAGGVSSGSAGDEGWYRVRKSWADASSQKGAFKSLENAKKCADDNPGHSVFDGNGSKIYPADPSAKKSVDAIAHEVIQGKWGNGAERKQRLTAVGYDYSTVQKRVNELLK